MSLAVRAEVAEDAEAIRSVLLAAFPTALEADLVDRLRRHFDSEISLVAEEGGKIVGHIMLSRMTAEGDGRQYRALGLAPVAVVPERQRRVGGALIEQALASARLLGEELVFVLGEPAYYARFGFSAETAKPFVSPYAGPYLMAQALTGLHLPAKGRAEHAPAFADLG
jgi:putative acetyltransferase